MTTGLRPHYKATATKRRAACSLKCANQRTGQ